MLEAIRHIVEALGREVFIVACFDQYPFSLACAMMGVQQVMLKLLDDRPLVEAVMERAASTPSAYASALADAGADMLSGGDSPAGLDRPATVSRGGMPYQRRVIAELKAPLLDARFPAYLRQRHADPAEIVDSGADVLELDHQVERLTACR